MGSSESFFRVYGQDGSLHAVMLSASLWEKVGHILEPKIWEIMRGSESLESPEPLHEWEELKKYWNFKYPVCTDVQCGNCGLVTDDWEHDPEKRFRLKSASFGGLVVFTCSGCGATIRKKHFKDHVCFEYSLGKCGR